MTINSCAPVNLVPNALWSRRSALQYKTIKSIQLHIQPQTGLIAAFKFIPELIRTYTQKCGTVSPTLYRVGQLKRTANADSNLTIDLI
jgi:hypothetical protein